MTGEPITELLWQRVESLLSLRQSRRYKCPGRRQVDDPSALAGIVFVLKTGIGWNQLLRTCWVSQGRRTGVAAGLGRGWGLAYGEHELLLA
jgi:transposase